MSELTEPQWDEFLSLHPDAHLLQTSAWGKLKTGFGWRAMRIAHEGVGAQILFRRLPLGLSLAYLPKGPVGLASADAGSSWEPFLPVVDRLCRQEKAVFLKVEPDLWQSTQTSMPAPQGFLNSQQDIQPARTLLVDLSGGEDQILARMKQKTRYNIRLALKKGVVVSSSSDTGSFHRMMLVTGSRDRFGVHSQEYYRRAYELFHSRGECELLVAEFEGEPLAALMVFARGSRAWYFYGASSDAHRDHMPTYLLQWEAMRWARERGCTVYDLWGVPDANENTLEAQFTNRSDGLWGVYRFKRGFGGELRRTQGPWDRVYNPMLYALYSWWLRRGSSSV